MKIYQLPMGARFEYAGQEYVKTGPLFGTGPAGARLIPKHAMLRLLDEVVLPSAAPRSETLLRSDVLKAFETFYAQSVALVAEDQYTGLEAARADFLRALGE